MRTSHGEELRKLSSGGSQCQELAVDFFDMRGGPASEGSHTIARFVAALAHTGMKARLQGDARGPSWLDDRGATSPLT
jgi:hypothetical protein